MRTRAGKPRASQLVGATEAAHILGVDKSTLTRWAGDGTLPSLGRLSDRRNSALIFDLKTVQAMADKRAAADGGAE
jgi:predicted site-specific integrase-resolvase